MPHIACAVFDIWCQRAGGRILSYHCRTAKFTFSCSHRASTLLLPSHSPTAPPIQKPPSHLADKAPAQGIVGGVNPGVQEPVPRLHIVAILHVAGQGRQNAEAGASHAPNRSSPEPPSTTHLGLGVAPAEDAHPQRPLQPARNATWTRGLPEDPEISHKRRRMSFVKIMLPGMQ